MAICRNKEMRKKENENVGTTMKGGAFPFIPCAGFGSI
jgi:hypothetical protein